MGFIPVYFSRPNRAASQANRCNALPFAPIPPAIAGLSARGPRSLYDNPVSQGGLAIGVELVGRPYDDEPILELAVCLEEAQGLFAGMG